MHASEKAIACKMHKGFSARLGKPPIRLIFKLQNNAAARKHTRLAVVLHGNGDLNIDERLCCEAGQRKCGANAADASEFVAEAAICI